MSLTTKVTDLATRIGTEFKTVRTEIASAVTTAESYADALASNYDAAGSAATAQAAAKSYADSLAANYDAAGSASAAQSAAIAYADALTTTDIAEGTHLYFTDARARSALAGMYDAAGAAAAAQSAAQSYADTLASNYDAAGAAATAESNAKSYADTKVSALVDSAPALLDTLNELAAALGDDPSFASSMSTALGLRVRVDAAQTLNSTQQTTARDNIGAASASDLGNVSSANFVSTFELALI